MAKSRHAASELSHCPDCGGAVRELGKGRGVCTKCNARLLNQVDQPAVTPDVAAATADRSLAGFAVRAGAYFIDALVGIFPMAVLLLFGVPFSSHWIRWASWLIFLIDWVWMPATFQGQTIGKMIVGIRIVRIDGSSLTYLRCLGRWAAQTCLYPGCILVGCTKQKRALHDYLVGTRVIYLPMTSAGRKALGELLGAIFLCLPLAIIFWTVRPGHVGLQEALTRMSLKTMRLTVSQYKNRNGKYPEQLSELQLPVEPLLKEHQNFRFQAANYDAAVCSGGGVNPAKVKDTGFWGYVSDPGAPCYGTIFVDCTHVDSKHKQWASY